MKGYVARKGNRWYAVIYEGTDPITGESGAAGIPPAANAPMLSGLLLDSSANATAQAATIAPCASASS